MIKTELNPSFDYPEDRSVVKYHNENIVLTILFSLPFVGQALLGLVVLFERMVIFVRQVRIAGIWITRRLTKMKFL